MTSTSDEVGHTATPWTIIPEKTREIDWLWVMHEQTRICRVVLYHGEKEEQRANAAFIVNAVNSHDSLVKALEKTTDWIVALAASGDAGFWDGEKVEEVIEARAALSQAKGGK